MHSTLCLLLLAASTLAHAQTRRNTRVAGEEGTRRQAAAGAAARRSNRLHAVWSSARPQQLMQDAGRFLQQQVPADRREAIGKQIEADVRRYVDETVPLVRERAIKLAPSTIGAQLEQKFTEDELRQLLAWFESPVNKKFQQSQRRDAERVPAKARRRVARRWSNRSSSARAERARYARRHRAGAAASAPRAAAKPPARPASR